MCGVTRGIGNFFSKKKAQEETNLGCLFVVEPPFVWSIQWLPHLVDCLLQLEVKLIVCCFFSFHSFLFFSVLFFSLLTISFSFLFFSFLFISFHFFSFHFLFLFFSFLFFSFLFFSFLFFL